MNNACEFSGGGYCLCSSCQSMRKMLEELEKNSADKLMSKEEAQKIFTEMEELLQNCNTNFTDVEKKDR